MHAVGAARHGRVHEFEGTCLQHRHEGVRGVEEQVGGASQGGAQGGVDDVRRRQAVVDPRTFGSADGVLDHVHEGGHVVVGDPLAVVDGAHQLRRHLGGPGPHRRGRVAGDRAHLGPALDGQQLDLEPHLEAGLVGEQRRHLRQRVAGDHAAPAAAPAPAPAPAAAPAPAETAAASAAMSVRYCIPSQPMRSTAA